MTSGKITGTPSSLPTDWALADGFLLGPSLNLTGTDLAGANLHGDDLAGANLSAANLSTANLSSANLSATNLSGADLKGTNLSTTNLSGADLKGSNLSGADLSRSTLNGVTSGGITGVPMDLTVGWQLIGGNLIGPLTFGHSVTLTLPAGRRGRSYRFQAVAVDGISPFKWRATTPLPKGLLLSASGYLTGTPSTTLVAGNHTFSVQVTDSTKGHQQFASAKLVLPLS